jgi:hypothetical protein
VKEACVAKLKAKQSFVDPDRGPLVSPRFIVSVVLMVLGIAWIVFYYVAVRPDPWRSGTTSSASGCSSSGC